MNKDNNEIFVLEDYESEFSYKKNKSNLKKLIPNCSSTTPKPISSISRSRSVPLSALRRKTSATTTNHMVLQTQQFVTVHFNVAVSILIALISIIRGRVRVTFQ